MNSVEIISDAKIPTTSRIRGLNPKSVTGTNENKVIAPAVFKLILKPVKSAAVTCEEPASAPICPESISMKSAR